MSRSNGWQEAGRFAARMYLVASLTMVAGLAGSILIYLTAGNVPDPARYGMEEYKEYLRALELYGGKANVLAVELTEWFDGMWHGTALAFTTGLITLLVSLALFLTAYHMTSGTKSREPAGKIPG